MATRRRYTDNELNSIYDKTDGCCHIFHKKLAFRNYGLFGEKGAWEVDHSQSLKQNGCSKLQNLFPARISCNRSKQAGSSKAARAKAGYGRSPYSPREKVQKRNKAAFLGGAVGTAAAALLGLPPAGAIGTAIIGGVIGRHIQRNPKVKQNAKRR